MRRETDYEWNTKGKWVGDNFTHQVYSGWITTQLKQSRGIPLVISETRPISCSRGTISNESGIPAPADVRLTTNSVFPRAVRYFPPYSQTVSNLLAYVVFVQTFTVFILGTEIWANIYPLNFQRMKRLLLQPIAAATYLTTTESLWMTIELLIMRLLRLWLSYIMNYN